MTKKISKIPSRIENAQVDELGNPMEVAGAKDILDDDKGKKQNVINQEVDDAIGNDETPDSIKGRIKELETQVGEGSVDERINEAVAPKANSADVYTKSETYNKTQLNNMITTPNQEYVTLVAESGDTLSDIFDGVTGAADTTYRVGNWDGSANSGTGGYDITVYSEYAYDGTNFIHLSTKTQIGEVFDISAYHATGGTLATYDDLADALGENGTNVPVDIRRGGMSVKYVSSSDHKYVQYRLMAQNFTTNITQWQGIEKEPAAGSKNLLESGAIEKNIARSMSFNSSEESITLTSTDEGYFINSNNVDVANPDYNIANFALQNVRVLHVVARTASYLYQNRYVFYDSSNNIITSNFATQPPVNDLDIVDLVVPDNAVKLRFGYNKYNTMSVTSTGISEVIKTIKSTNTEFGEIKYVSTKVGYYLNNKGTEGAQAKLSIAKFAVYGCPKIHFELNVVAGNSIVFYDSNDNIISIYEYTQIPSSQYFTQDLQCPLGTKYIRVSYINIDYKTAITNNVFDIHSCDKSVIDNINTDKEIGGNISFESTEVGNGFINENFEKESNANYKVNVYQIIGTPNKVHVTARSGASCAVVAFYDSNDTPILGYKGSNDGATITVDKDCIIPKNASYFKVSYDIRQSLDIKIPSNDTSIIPRITKLENELEIESVLKGKKIVWLGTSIPASGGATAYPKLVGDILGANVYNEAIGSSCMRIGRIAHDVDNPLGDEFGLTGVNWDNLLKSLAMTQEEKMYIMERWTTAERQAKLIEEGYTSEQVANVQGYSNLLGGEYESQSSTSSVTSWPSKKPIDIMLSAYSDVRTMALSYCWDSNGGQGVDGKIQKYLTSGDEPYLWVIDHMRNDFAVKGSETWEQENTIPTDIEDRHYPIGAMVYLIHKIWSFNHNAKIVIMGHYMQSPEGNMANRCCEAQKKVSEIIGVPYIDWQRHSNVSDYPVLTAGYWDNNNVWHETGYSGTDNVTNWTDTPITLTAPDGHFTAGTMVHRLPQKFMQMQDGVHPERLSTRQIWAEKMSRLLAEVAKTV